jgi:hypothetical protein
VRQYQVRQTTCDADIAVAADVSLEEAALAAAVAQSLHQVGIPEPHVTISRAETIARDLRTGKARRFVPTQPAAAGPPARPNSSTRPPSRAIPAPPPACLTDQND